MGRRQKIKNQQEAISVQLYGDNSNRDTEGESGTERRNTMLR